MGLSRNKVAVSEGAAGSPPFYGDHEIFSRRSRSRKTSEVSRASEYGTFVVQFSEIKANASVCENLLRQDSQRSLKKKKATLGTWGCSSAGRAPALQAGGHGFEPHHLHQSSERKITYSLFTLHKREGMRMGTMETNGERLKERSVAQVVRAHA